MLEDIFSLIYLEYNGNPYRQRGWTLGLSPCRFDNSRRILGAIWKRLRLYTQLAVTFGTVFCSKFWRLLDNRAHVGKSKTQISGGWDNIEKSDKIPQEKMTIVALFLVPGYSTKI